MNIMFVGINLAKNVVALHGVDDASKARLVRPAVRRDQLLETIAKLPPCTIGMVSPTAVMEPPMFGVMEPATGG